jgi:hypothetical protein
MSNLSLESFSKVVQKTWPINWAEDVRFSADLQSLIERVSQGSPSAIPYVNNKKNTIHWAITASSVREIRDYYEDAKAWLQQVDQLNLTGEIVQLNIDNSNIAQLLAVVSPEGYGKWSSSIDRGRPIVLRLSQMHKFLSSKPEISKTSIPTLPTLRLAFVTALSVGDWSRAESCIDEIDRWNLDQAINTLHMRIRLLEAQGDIEELFKLASRQEAWNFSSPRRIATAILNSVDAVVIQTEENARGLSSAFHLFKNDWYKKLYQIVEDARDEIKVSRILAMASVVDKNRTNLERWTPHISTELANFLIGQLPTVDLKLIDANVTSTATANSNFDNLENLSQNINNPEQIVKNFWPLLQVAIKNGRSVSTHKLLDQIDDQFLNDTEFLSLAPDGLLELLSDPAIDSNRSSHLLRQDAIAKIIDAFVGANEFPRLDHLDCYLSLLEGMVILNSDSMNSNESQLLLGLVGASVHLSSTAVNRCEQIVRQWWSNRPLVQRLDWLAGSLDTLAAVHSDPSRLVDLYISGLNLASRRGQFFTSAQIRSWESIGYSLELTDEVIKDSLKTLLRVDNNSQVDPLAVLGLQHVAIISLQETSAREAAREIERRSGAKVIVVTSSVADFQAKHAKSSDLILYVWAATSHATYRSLDSVRDRIEYVQGTGSSSILVAAERWAEKKSI